MLRPGFSLELPPGISLGKESFRSSCSAKIETLCVKAETLGVEAETWCVKAETLRIDADTSSVDDET